MATANDHRWVVAFAGARDSYQVPIALHESGLLHKLVTDSYTPLDRPLPAAVAEVLPSPMRSKLRRRFSPALPSRLVKSHSAYPIRNWWEPDGWMYRVGSLGERAGQIAAKEHCSILAYAHLATSAFAGVGSRRKVLIQMQPHPRSVKAALDRTGSYRSSRTNSGTNSIGHKRYLTLFRGSHISLICASSLRNIRTGHSTRMGGTRSAFL